VRLISDDERRSRLARRHGLAGRLVGVEAATEAMTALHATEAATVYLSLWARVRDVTTADIDRALYTERTIVKQLAMRRTLFVFPRALLPAALGSAAARTADMLRARLAKDLVAAGLADDADSAREQLLAAREAVAERLDGGELLPAAQLRDELPALAGTMTVGGPDKKWGGEQPIAPRLLALFSAEGTIVRGRNGADWHRNKPTWTSLPAWLGETVAPLPSAAGYAELVRRWLRTFGPGTTDDLVWWLGGTKTIVRQALADIDAAEVALDGAASGWLLADDVEHVEPVAPWAALLPSLDPTVMGWKHRHFYLDPALTPYLFDTNGNAGTTAWWNGRIVGAWVQDPDATVRPIVGEDIGADGLAALEREAARLTDWLAGRRISNVYASQLMKSARLT